MTSTAHLTRPNRTRPISVTLLAVLLIAAGTVGFAYHASELDWQRVFRNDAVWILLVRLAAVVAGVFMLRGANWARWLALGWMAYHVLLSVFHSWSETAVHLLFFAVLLVVLLRRHAAEFFDRSTRPSPGEDRVFY